MASNSANSIAKPRLYWMGGLLLLWVGAICARLVYLQIFDYGEFQARAQHQQQRAFETSPIRGVVYDRNGRELGYSALSTLEGMLPPHTALKYEGVVESGAPLAVWRETPYDPSPLIGAREVQVELPLKDLPDPPACK